MKARLEPRMVAARIQGLPRRVPGQAGAARTTPSSQGFLKSNVFSQRLIRRGSTSRPGRDTTGLGPRAVEYSSVMDGPLYPAARAFARRLEDHFTRGAAAS